MQWVDGDVVIRENLWSPCRDIHTYIDRQTDRQIGGWTSDTTLCCTDRQTITFIITFLIHVGRFYDCVSSCHASCPKYCTKNTQVNLLFVSSAVWPRTTILPVELQGLPVRTMTSHHLSERNTDALCPGHGCPDNAFHHILQSLKLSMPQNGPRPLPSTSFPVDYCLTLDFNIMCYLQTDCYWHILTASNSYWLLLTDSDSYWQILQLLSAANRYWQLLAATDSDPK